MPPVPIGSTTGVLSSKPILSDESETGRLSCCFLMLSGGSVSDCCVFGWSGSVILDSFTNNATNTVAGGSFESRMVGHTKSLDDFREIDL